MATILYAWELGGGLGHVSVAAPVLAALRQRGHRVVAVVSDLASGHRLFAPHGISCYQAPRFSRPPHRPIQPVCTFAHLLNNRAFGNFDAALATASAWRHLIDNLQPSLAIFDHCPSGLLATRGLPLRRAVIGTGFTCPPPLSPFPRWRDIPILTIDSLRHDEQEVLAIVNRVLAVLKRPPLERLCDVYSGADAEILTTYPELDHFGQRPTATYYGVWPDDNGGEDPQWPTTPGRRIFAYLKSSPELAAVLTAIANSQLPTVAFCPDAPTEFRDYFLRSSTLRIVATPQRMSSAVAGCAFAITNGTHTTVAQMLRSGKPVISIPKFIEQLITGERVVAMQAGLCLPNATVDATAAALTTITSRDFPGARQFADKYAHENGADSVQRIADQLHELAAANPSAFRPQL